ncbi:C4-dicarboxylate ABC transporter substrate-binding protein [Brachybacterium sp. P6-10-X1]|uniref:TRAP transporter substrate-binding protein n=1 Tax=Brachybacterium sp. P6-10-X1 TaxID=1903186 RepID=UPI000971BDB9|nr:TRAP transporter substrate-binding protein [Brachybacterium sp. P6-10-X1]APX33653.1 C4-dicarboxylate ABC transporter substrate-binding protein [Brachybacterium sp. P6-10-X1]
MKCKALLSGVLALALTSLTACAQFTPIDESALGDEGSGIEAETVYRVAFNQPETHPQYVALSHLGERMSEATGGACALEVFPNESLGPQADTIELVQAGSVDFAMVAGSLMENFNSDFVVFNLPYVFDSKEHQRRVLDDPEITGELFSSLENKNISVIAGFHGGIRNVYNSVKPIETPEDLAGMKIRVIGSDTNIAMMELMGGSGAPMGQGEVYTAIQSGILEGGENNESIYANLSHDEVAPYYSYTQHLMFPDYLISNPTTLDRMAPECREFLEEDIANATAEEGELWTEEVERSHEMAVEAGAQFNEVDIDAFREAVQPLVDESLDSPVTRNLYDDVRAAAE